MYIYLCLYLSMYLYRLYIYIIYIAYIYIYIYVYICAWCRQWRCRGVHTQHTPANISVYIGVYIGMPAAVSGGAEECTLNTRLLMYSLVFFPHKPLPPSLTRLEGSIPHTHTHISICTLLLVVYDSNSSFGGRLRHRLVAPVFHGSATLTRPMLQPYLNISQYISIHVCI